ncbi:MAG TPA: BlaI/MecI/CopY family transcriptional regulator [Candidatus Solibacter sp.]|nr:BlaI/MecI/CopY family transcriptional regulator [Candidatus Solibacter sp.]
MARLFPFFRSNVATRLGPLERKMLEEVWSRGSVTVRELLADGKSPYAYTTLMTTLDRLYKKGLLQRVVEGKAFRYSSGCTREELPRLVAVTDIKKWIESDPASLSLSYFVEAISASDARLLNDLQVLVDRKRRELKMEKLKTGEYRRED